MFCFWTVFALALEPNTPGQQLVAQGPWSRRILAQLPMHIRPHVLEIKEGNTTGNCGFAAIGITNGNRNASNWREVRFKMLEKIRTSEEVRYYLDVTNPENFARSTPNPETNLPYECSAEDTENVLNTRQSRITDEGQWFHAHTLGALAATVYGKALIFFDCIEPDNSQTFTPINDDRNANLDPAACMVIARVNSGGCPHYVALMMEGGVYGIPPIWDRDTGAWENAYDEQIGMGDLGL